MLHLKTKITTTVITGALLMTAFAPAAFADTNIEISGNGSGSYNSVAVSSNGEGSNRQTEINQSNEAMITNDVSINSNTGNNQANDNTGGFVGISTGSTSSDVMIHNSANTNVVGTGSDVSSMCMNRNWPFSNMNDWMNWCQNMFMMR